MRCVVESSARVRARFCVATVSITAGGSTTVNAVHATVFGVVDVVLASATAGIH